MVWEIGQPWGLKWALGIEGILEGWALEGLSLGTLEGCPFIWEEGDKGGGKIW